MYVIKPLDWDSNFFGYKIGMLNLPINATVEDVSTDDYRLVYIFANEAIEQRLCNKKGIELIDIKTELIKKINNDSIIISEEESIVIKVLTELNDELLQLVIESGAYSRFKLDKKFVNKEFERLYSAWIEKALNNSSSVVFGAFLNKKLVGFISLSFEFEIAQIGLIAVQEYARNKHIGKQLLAAANNFAMKQKMKYIAVVTQQDNKNALLFYERNGFTIHKKNYIYHLWTMN
jgi:dTDP-4-amino-4,6-dideoxy-D-galactose acyltransferase